MSVDWDDIRVFLVVAREGAISAAARALGLSHATVWRRMHAIEAATGAQLFDRTPYGFVLSQAGTAFRRRLEPMSDRIDAAVRTVREKPATIAGEVCVSAPVVVGDVLAQRAVLLHGRHPDLRLELNLSAPTRTPGPGFDIALTLEPGFFAGFVGDASARIPFGLYASPSYVAERGLISGPGDLDGHAFIDFETASRHIAPASLSLARQSNMEVVFRSNSPIARRAAARAGMGVVMESEAVGDADPGLVRISSSTKVGEITVWVHLAADRRRERSVLVVRDWVIECLAAFTEVARPQTADAGD